MAPFEHVTALLSFVYALALTHLLARAAELVIARERVRFSGLLTLAMINAMTLVFANWLSIWDLRTVQSWDLASITIQFLLAISLYVLCVFAGPRPPEEHDRVDLEDFFWRQRPYFYGTVLVMLVLSLAANLDFLKSGNASLFIKENMTVLPMLIPTILALASRARWAQWVAGLSLLAMVIAFTIIFSNTLN